MPEGIVRYDTEKVEQSVINGLKKALPQIITDALNTNDTIAPGYRGEKPAVTPVKTVMVTQSAFHPTDVNVPPIEIRIIAGEARGRNPDLVAKRIAKAISAMNWIPQEFLEGDKSSVWLHFSLSNGFCPIPR